MGHPLDPLLYAIPYLRRESFLAAVWAGTAIALILVILRLVVRWRTFGRLYSDDYLVVVAFCLLLFIAVLDQVYITGLYKIVDLLRGLISMPVPPGFFDDVYPQAHAALGIYIMSYTIVWMIKLSFIIFFRRLSDKVPGYKRFCFFVAFFVFATWVAIIGTLPFNCFEFDHRYDQECHSYQTWQFEKMGYILVCTTDLVSDVLILSIPFSLLWRVNLPRSQRLSIAGGFSLNVLVMFVAIVRVVFIAGKIWTIDIAWLQFWLFFEPCISVTIAGLVAFRHLFIRRPAEVVTTTYRPRFSTPAVAKKASDSKLIHSLPGSDGTPEASDEGARSHELIDPPEMVHVRHGGETQTHETV